MKKLIPLILLTALVGCVSPYQATVDDYVDAYPNINLGMSKLEVQAILNPSQSRLSSSEKKRPDRYMKEGIAVEILYFRSGWNSDGLTTDDEFTPYIFNDDKLVAIGWQVLGGAKTQGQARDSIYYDNSSSTIVY